jgi:hypothetical protein
MQVVIFFFSRRRIHKRSYGDFPSAVPKHLAEGRVRVIASGILSAMDLSGQTLLDQLALSSSKHVRQLICEDFVRVGDTVRIGIQLGSKDVIRIQPAEFNWPDRDAYRYREHSLKRVMQAWDSDTTSNAPDEPSRAARIPSS